MKVKITSTHYGQKGEFYDKGTTYDVEAKLGARMCGELNCAVRVKEDAQAEKAPPPREPEKEEKKGKGRDS